MWADVSLTPQELKELYSEKYFKGEEYLDYEKERSALLRNFAGRLRELVADNPHGGYLLEIGCAYGFFLAEAQKHFDVLGCDICESGIEYARDTLGLNVVCQDYSALRLERKPDVVCLWDTVEHLEAPDVYLGKVAKDIRAGGTLALSTGDIGALAARIRGEKWRLIHPPTHIHYFTANSMRRLLERLGFENIRIRHLAFWRSARAVAARLLPPIAYRRLHRLMPLDFSFPVNLFDLMTVFASKGGEALPESAEGTGLRSGV